MRKNVVLRPIILILALFLLFPSLVIAYEFEEISILPKVAVFKKQFLFGPLPYNNC